MFRHLGHGIYLLDTLSKLRTKALRKRVWFAALTDQERILVGLIHKNVKIVRNSTLATVIARIIVKLIPAIRNAFWNRMERIGSPIDLMFSRTSEYDTYRNLEYVKSGCEKLAEQLARMMNK